MLHIINRDILRPRLSKRPRYTGAGSSQVKFCKLSNKGKVLWLRPTKRGADIRALVEANAELEPVDCEYEL